MAVRSGRLEALHYFAANKTAAFTSNAGGPTTFTLTAGSYYLAQIVSQMNTDLAGLGFVVSISDGEGTPSSATGLCTIAAPGQYNISVTFTSTEIRDLLGFTGNIVAASSAQTGTRHCPGLWLPANPGKFTRHGDYDAGTLNTQTRQTIGPTGAVYTVGGGTAYFRDLQGVLWDGVPATRVRPQYNSSGTQTSTTNETLEEYLGNTFYGTGTYASLFTRGASNRLYWNADDDTKYVAGKFLWPERFDPDTFQPGYTAFYRVPAGRFVVGA